MQHGARSKEQDAPVASLVLTAGALEASVAESEVVSGRVVVADLEHPVGPAGRAPDEKLPRQVVAYERVGTFSS